MTDGKQQSYFSIAKRPKDASNIDPRVLMAQMFSECKSDLMKFRRIFLPVDKEVATPSFQEEWGQILLHGKHHYAVEGFRESGKSGVVLRAFPMHCLTYPSKERQYVVFIMATQRAANKRLKEIEEEWLNNELLSMNLVRIVEQSQNGFEVILKDENGQEMWVRFEAYGKGAAIRGLNSHDTRPSIVLIDDPQDLEDAKSDTVQEGDWEWFLSDVLFWEKYTDIHDRE